MLADMVRALGVDHVLTASDGREALDTLMSEPVDLVITDLKMPVMDGLELTRRLRSQPSKARIPILMVSGEGADEAQALEAGVSRFLPKPLRLHQLQAALDALAPALGHPIIGNVVRADGQRYFVARTRLVPVPPDYRPGLADLLVGEPLSVHATPTTLAPAPQTASGGSPAHDAVRRQSATDPLP